MFIPKTTDELQSLLEPIRKRLALHIFIRQLTVFGLWGLGGSVLLLLLARLWPIPYYGWIAFSLFVLSLVIGGASVFWRKPTALQSARFADENGLAQRVVTAWENRANESRVAAMQREDALRWLRKQLPQIVENIHVWADVRKNKYAIGGLAVVFLALFLWPNPQDVRLAQLAEEQKLVAQVEKEVEAIKQEAKTNPAMSEEQKKQLEEMLEQTKKALAKADDPAERLNALRAAEKQLEKLREAEQRKASALAQLQRNLGSQQGTRALAEAMDSGDRQKMTDALKQMEKALEAMTPKEREQLGSELEKAANELQKAAEAAQSEELKEIANQLAQAAEQTAQGQVPQAMTAMQDSLMQAMAGTQQAQQGMLAAANAAASLQQSQMTLASAGAAGSSGTAGAGAASGTPGTSPAVPASGNPSTGTAANANPGSGAANQPAGGNNGNGQGNGSGQGNGTGQGNGSGTGDGSGSGQGSGQGSGAGLGAGNHELVTIPSNRIGGDNGPSETVGGPLGAGPSQSQQSGDTQVSSGSTLPYEEVYGQYEQFARESMEKSSIPGDYQEVVKEYFSKIEP
ncbi:hypothetical protein [Brevibacillus reuszeri]|uniref:hypothetical protein n=1 Tax=Brevibacillus reuszeri TaxID=54915 RepID=UPI000CCC4339|nr:hypothetical protein [Brevibacillus reuszeri]